MGRSRRCHRQRSAQRRFLAAVVDPEAGVFSSRQFQKQNNFSDSGTILSCIFETRCGSRHRSPHLSVTLCRLPIEFCCKRLRQFHSAHRKYSQFPERYSRALAPGRRRRGPRGADLASLRRILTVIENRKPTPITKSSRTTLIFRCFGKRRSLTTCRLGALSRQWLKA